MNDRHLKHGIGIFSHRQSAEQALVKLRRWGIRAWRVYDLS